MDENTKFVVDASFVLAFLLPDEEIPEVESLFDKYKSGQVSLVAPPLLLFEVFNSLKTAFKRHRLNETKICEIAQDFISLKIDLLSIDHMKTLDLAIKRDLTFYDASYVVLAAEQNCPLLTLDKKLQKLGRNILVS